jgi:hypothetical protein
MILGMSTATFTLLHVLVSLVGIGSGFVVLYGLLTAKRLDGWTAVFLATTALTSISGFGFPFDHLLPSHKVGIISLVVQSFLKVPALKALAPTQQEPPFLIAQLVVLLAFIWLTILAVKKFRIGTERATSSAASVS